MRRIIVGIFILMLICSVSIAETVYVICQPESFVYVRKNPKFGSTEVAYLQAGDAIETDWKKSGPWLHVYVKCEAGEGWIHRGYVTESEPVVYEHGTQAATIFKNVRARRYANGKIRRKLKKGAQVIAYVISDEWTVTDAGFIQTGCLKIGGGDD